MTQYEFSGTQFKYSAHKAQYCDFSPTESLIRGNFLIVAHNLGNEFSVSPQTKFNQ